MISLRLNYIIEIGLCHHFYILVMYINILWWRGKTHAIMWYFMKVERIDDSTKTKKKLNANRRGEELDVYIRIKQTSVQYINSTSTVDSIQFILNFFYLLKHKIWL